MKKNYPGLLTSVLTLPLRVRYLPRHMQMDITTSCNLNCRMCYAKKAVDEGQKQKSLRFEDFKKMFDDVCPDSVNLAASGEPFLNADLVKMIRYAKGQHAQVIISTNFIVPDEEKMREIVDAGLDVLKISIDGATKVIYETIRGPHFDRLLANLKTLERVRGEKPASDIRVRIDFVMLKTNAGDIPRIIGFARDHHIDHVFFRVCDPRGWDSAQRAELLDGSFAEIVSQMKTALQEAKKCGVSTNIADLLRQQKRWGFIYEDSRFEAVPEQPPVCVLPWMQLFTSVTGDMSYCCSIYPSGKQALGNILHGDGWNTERWQTSRAVFKSRKNYGMFEGCRYCIPMSRGHLFNVIQMFPGYLRRFLGIKR
jgi:MoaA/NifB/PqqE/SkfB family radical SAM enzyme